MEFFRTPDPTKGIRIMPVSPLTVGDVLKTLLDPEMRISISGLPDDLEVVGQTSSIFQGDILFLVQSREFAPSIDWQREPYVLPRFHREPIFTPTLTPVQPAAESFVQ